MKTTRNTARTGLMLIASVFCATATVKATNSVTLEWLLIPGNSITSGDKVFFNFHNFTEIDEDLEVGEKNIFVSPIVGGPGAQETEFGIRFSSALWTLTGSNQSYDMGIDFHVRAPSARITDNTLEFTGGSDGDGRAQIAEGVLDHATGATLANKFVFFDKAGSQLQDHQVFPGGPYLELEISKDFSMTTGADQASRVFVSHFDQTFSQVPEGGPGLLGLFSVIGILGWAGRGRFRNAVR